MAQQQPAHEIRLGSVKGHDLDQLDRQSTLFSLFPSSNSLRIPMSPSKALWSLTR
jgi:hypothetical protein